MMTEQAHDKRSSAEIIPFPVKARASRAGAQQTGRGIDAPVVANVEFGSGWYHDAAIREEMARHR